MSVRIQMRRDTSTNWTSNNPILAAGELGLETNTKAWKIGDGVSVWSDLSYANQSFSGGSTIAADTSQDALRITQTGSGNAFVIEDSANPDATPFVISGTGNVGIGKTNPLALLDVEGGSRFTGQITSTISTGTAPFVVASTTSVTNLNADMLDGQHGSHYAPIASPDFSGTPLAPTASQDTNTTQIATTAFVIGQGYLKSSDISSVYLTQSNAASTYLTQSNAASTYATKESVTKIVINNKSASYTLEITDAGNIIEMDSSSANTVTIPGDSSIDFPTGTTIDIIQIGTGKTTLVADSNVTIYSSGSKLGLTEQFAAATIYKKSANTWVAMGNLS